MALKAQIYGPLHPRYSQRLQLSEYLSHFIVDFTAAKLLRSQF